MSSKTAAPAKQGKLLIIATPIGNLGDMTQRALDALAQADVVLAEDTRVTGKLLRHFEIDTPLQRCDENVIRARSAEVMERIVAGDAVAFCSDAGTPGVSDPGAVLVDAALQRGLTIEVLPGASAVLTAVVAAGFTCPNFYFGAFLPRKAAEQRALLESLAALDSLLVFYESPHRVAATAAVIAQVFPARQVVLARELTKMHEEVVRLSATDLAQELKERSEIKGECVLVIGPPSKEELVRVRAAIRTAGLEDVESVVAQLKEAGDKSRAAMAKELAARCGIARNEAYELLG